MKLSRLPPICAEKAFYFIVFVMFHFLRLRKTTKYYVIHGGYLFSVVGVDVLDDPITYCAVETALRHREHQGAPLPTQPHLCPSS